MKIFIVFLLLLSTTSLSAQKIYDCILLTKSEDSLAGRYKGFLVQLGDSGITLKLKESEEYFSWRNMNSAIFRKHNGYSRTMLPIIFGSSVGLTVYSLAEKNVFRSTELPKTTLFILFTAVYSAIFTAVLTPVFWLTRNHVFEIKDYADYLAFKKQAGKYLLSPTR